MEQLIEQARGPHGNEDWLPGGSPSGGFGQAPTRHAAIELNIDTGSKMMQFTMKPTAGENLTGHTDADGYFIFIPSGAYIALTIELSGDWNWRFDDEPLSFKVRGNSGHYRLYSKTDRAITIWAKSTDTAPVPPSVGHSKSHGFNIYVLMDQTPVKAFPVRLDPDLKNPPPPQFDQPTSGPVPLA